MRIRIGIQMLRVKGNPAELCRCRAAGQDRAGDSAEEVLEIQQAVRRVGVDEQLVNYTLAIVEKTRQHEILSLGVSRAGSMMLLPPAQALALVEGATIAIPDDFKRLTLPSRAPLRGELTLHFNTQRNPIKQTPSWKIIESTPVPCSSGPAFETCAGRFPEQTREPAALRLKGSPVARLPPGQKHRELHWSIVFQNGYVYIPGHPGFKWKAQLRRIDMNRKLFASIVFLVQRPCWPCQRDSNELHTGVQRIQKEVRH